MTALFSGQPTVVDSPLPQTPADPVPVGTDHSELTDAKFAEATELSAEQLAAIAAQTTRPAQPSAEQQALNSRLQQLSSTFNRDFSGFTSITDAEAAARLIAEDLAMRGLQSSDGIFGNENLYQQPNPNSIFDDGPTYQHGYNVNPFPAQLQQQQWQIPGADQRQPEPDPWKLDEIENLDPKIKNQLKALQSQAQAAIQQSQQAVQQVQKQFINSQKQAVKARGRAAIDALNNPKYGTATKSTALQTVARKNLERLVQSVIDGMVLNGQQVPVIEQVVQMAALLDSGLPLQASDQATQQETALQPRSQTAGPRSLNLQPKRTMNQPHDPLGILNDDSFRAGLQAIAAKY